MSERGDRKKKLIDRFIGIPLTLPAFIFRRLTRKKSYSFQRIAIICIGGIGDLLMVTALIQALKKEKTFSTIDIYTAENNKQAVCLLDNINRHYSFKIANARGFISELRTHSYDILIDTTQWARVSSLICAASGAGITVGFKTKNQYRSLPYDIKVEHSGKCHEYVNFLMLGKAVFPDINSAPEIKNLEPLKKYSEPYLICHMYAAGSNTKEREWGEENWLKLTRKLAEKGFNILLSGSSSQKNDIDLFIKKSCCREKFFNLAGNTDLKEFAALCLNASAVISVNSGPMHIAALSGAPVIALNGPTNPDRWGAVGSKSVNLFPSGAIEMLNLGFEKVSTDSNASNITVEQVTEALKKLTVI